MKVFDPAIAADHAAGRIDAVDVLTLVFDSATMHLALGVTGTYVFDDPTIGEMEIIGTGNLVSLDVPESALGPASQAITATLFETYLEEGSDVPVNIFDDGVRATIDEENWEGRPAIGSILWLSEAGAILGREQVFVREIDAMPMEWDEAGNPMRRAILEEPDIIQRDIEGRTANAELQAMIDPDDDSFSQVGVARLQEIHFGQRAEGPVI